jgi:hypothetical protein
LLTFFAAAKKVSAAPHRGNANKPEAKQGKANAAETQPNRRTAKPKPKPKKQKALPPAKGDSATKPKPNQEKAKTSEPRPKRRRAKPKPGTKPKTPPRTGANHLANLEFRRE